MARIDPAVRAVLDGSLFYEAIEQITRIAWTEGVVRGALRGGRDRDYDAATQKAYEDWRVHGTGGNLPGAQIFATELREAHKQAALDEQAAALAEMKRQAEQRATVFPCDLCGRSLQGESVYERLLAEPRGLWHLACWEGLSKYLPGPMTNGDGA